MKKRSTPLLCSCSSRAKFFFHHVGCVRRTRGRGSGSCRSLVTHLLLGPDELVFELAMSIVQNAIL